MISDSNTINILIVEDCEFTATGLEVSFAPMSDIKVVGIVADGGEAWEFLKKTPYKVDVVLMDISTQYDEESGIKYTKQLKWLYPSLCFIAYSAFGNKRLVKKFFDAGGVGFLEKIDGASEIIEAIKCVCNGGRYMSKNARKYSGGFKPESPKRLESALLTSKQLKVLKLRAEGKTNKEIAQQLNLSIETIKSHTKNIIVKLDATNIPNAIFKATKLELI